MSICTHIRALIVFRNPDENSQKMKKWSFKQKQQQQKTPNNEFFQGIHWSNESFNDKN